MGEKARARVVGSGIHIELVIRLSIAIAMFPAVFETRDPLPKQEIADAKAGALLGRVLLLRSHCAQSSDLKAWHLSSG